MSEKNPSGETFEQRKKRMLEEATQQLKESDSELKYLMELKRRREEATGIPVQDYSRLLHMPYHPYQPPEPVSEEVAEILRKRVC